MTAGTAEIGFSQRDGLTRLDHLYQRDPLRVLFPRPAAGDPALAVMVTTSGGLVAGDQLTIAIRLAPGAIAHVTASAAEKIYRSTGPITAVGQALTVSSSAILEFLPPETILFDGARMRRETSIELGAGAGFLGGDIVIFGRRARGEGFTSGLLHEVWTVRREGDLLWGDAVHLEGDIARVIHNSACFGGAAGFATMIMSPPKGDARSMLDCTRTVQSASAGRGLQSGVTMVAGLLIARWLADDPAALRRAYADLACELRSAAFGLPRLLPRGWYV